MQKQKKGENPIDCPTCLELIRNHFRYSNVKSLVGEHNTAIIEFDPPSLEEVYKNHMRDVHHMEG